MKEKTGFVLLAFGGADSVENVEPFLKNVIKGRSVTPEMVEKLRERYKLIGGRSPLLDITKAQAKAVEELLRKRGLDYKAYVGMRYWHPYIKDVLKQMKDDGVDFVIAVVMANFVTKYSTGGYQTDAEAAVNELGGGNFRVEFSQGWHLKPLFLDAIIENAKKELDYFTDKKDVLVIFSNHSLPRPFLEGDPYEMIIGQTVEALTKRLSDYDCRVAYQSKGPGRDWIGPGTEEVIEEAKKMGKKGVVVVPLGFVADHIETLYDIDILFKGIAETQGLIFRRSASLNASPKFMELVAGIIEKHAERR